MKYKWTYDSIMELIAIPLKQGELEREIAQRLGITQPRVSQLKRVVKVPEVQRTIEPPPTCDYCQAWVDWATRMRADRFNYKQIGDACYMINGTVIQRLRRWKR